ncbi:MAG: D-aminoacylase [Clostridiales bacterium]|nr:D-aminoacylase [Clostridiales bacterium]
MKRRQFLELSSQMVAVAAFSHSSLLKLGSPPPEFGLVIQNGTIINGLGEAAFQADIGISNGKIRFIGRLTGDMSRRPTKIIDASGRVVCPGFIDIHSHSGLELLVNPKAESKIRQGVTTELSGNCGGSDFPLKTKLSEEAQQYWNELGLKPTWVDLAGFREQLTAQGISLNYATLIGHGTLRSYVMGEERRRPTASELEKMKELVAAAMEQGAFGLSTGLEYTPSGFAEREEIIELCRVVAQHDGFYATHIRSEDNQVIEAVGEAISVAEEAKLPGEISHLKACGQRNWWKMPYLFDLIEKASARGVDVTADAYPYTAYSTGLTVFFPFWAMAGGDKVFLKRLASAEERQKMRSEVEEKLGGMPWENVVIVDLKTAKNKPLIGLNIAAAAKTRKQDPFDFSCDLLLEEGGDVSIVGFGMSEANTEAALRHPLVMIASDGSSLAPYGPLHRGLPHPRNYGAFPRFLGHYVREKNILSLPEAIKKISSLPAAKMGLNDRGILKPDYWADIVVFDPNKILDLATYTEPEKYPAGIDYVLVNGEVVIDHGEHTGARAGRILSNPKKRLWD